MDLNTFIVSVFTFVDDWYQGQSFRLRQRGPQPRLADSEVLTIEVVGAFLGLRTEKELFHYFRRHYGSWFPQLRQVHRTTFTRQAANLWRVKEALWHHLLQQVDCDPALSIVDSFPIPVCRVGRAHRSRRLREWAAWGYDDVAKRTFFGLRGHVRICWPGVVVGLTFCPADVHDRWVAEQLLAGVSGWALGDGSYWSPDLQQQLRRQGLALLAPRKRPIPWTKHPWPRWLIHKRRRLETVISQLVERFDGKRVRVRDFWHFCSRWLRAVLSHTFAFFLGQQVGLHSPLRFAELLSD